MANTPSTTRPTAAKKVTRPATKRAAKKVTASWLVQNGTSAVGGQHVKEAAKGKALTILRRNVREYAKTGKNASASRKAGGSTNQMAKGKGTRVPTPDEFLVIVGQFLRKMDKAERPAYCARLRTVVSEVEKEAAAPGSNREPRTGTKVA
jgi:uncharacterized protein (DUF927 family)